MEEWLKNLSLSDKFKQIDIGQNKAAYRVFKQNCSDVVLQYTFPGSMRENSTIGLRKGFSIALWGEQAVALLFLVRGAIIAWWSLF